MTLMAGSLVQMLTGWIGCGTGTGSAHEPKRSVRSRGEVAAPPAASARINAARLLLLDLITVLWTDAQGDYANSGDKVFLKRELSALKPGAIILLHDGAQDTVDTLSAFLRAVRVAGFEFVTLEALRRH